MPRGIPNSQPLTSTTPPGHKISALLKGSAGQNPDLTELPQEHEIHLLDAAREYYTSDPPVFLSERPKSAGSVNQASLASEGHVGAPGVRVSVTTRAWSNRGGAYQTIDLNGERVIVKLFRGGPRGGFYRRWMGVIAGFEKQPIAFAFNEAREAREARQRKKREGRASLPGDDSEWPDLVTSDAKPAIARKRKSLPSFVDQSGDTSEDEFRPRKRIKEMEKSPKYTPTGRTALIEQLRDLVPAATMNPPKSRPNLPRASVASSTAAPEVRIKQEPGAPEKRIRLPGPPKAPSIPLVQPANTSSVRSQGQSSNINLSSRPTPPSSRDNSSRDIPKSKNPSTATTSSSSSSSSSSSKATAISIPLSHQKDKYEELISDFLSSPSLTTTTTMMTSSLSQPDTSSSSSSSSAAAAAAAAAAAGAVAVAAPILSPQKQAATILSVYLNPDEDYVPLYLRSCMTISRFFASCLGAFELDERPETVSALRVRLEHIPIITTEAAAAADEVGMKHQGASWLVKRAVPDSFDIFLEAVNKWAGWKDRESCAVRVEIMLRAKK